MAYNVYFVGVGGQGILTIGEILAEAAREDGIPVNFFPSKGMAQRGGFVKAQLRIGRELAGPNIPERGADLIIAMEISEALKAIRFIRPGGDFLLLGDRWLPVSVILGKERYPQLEIVLEQVVRAQGKLHTVDLQLLPSFEGTPIPPNLFLLGYALRSTQVGSLITKDRVTAVIKSRWDKKADMNLFAFQAGYEADFLSVEAMQ